MDGVLQTARHERIPTIWDEPNRFVHACRDTPIGQVIVVVGERGEYRMQGDAPNAGWLMK
jgi:hypothetical protein